MVGETVTLFCTFGDAIRVSDQNLRYSVTLKDCALQKPPIENSSPSRTAQAGERKDPVNDYQPCVQATQPLRVPDQIDLDEPVDFSSSEEPPPQFTFLFSEHGVDVYAVRTNKFGPAGYDRLALLVFQDDKFRRDVLRGYISAGLVQFGFQS